MPRRTERVLFSSSGTLSNRFEVYAADTSFLQFFSLAPVWMKARSLPPSGAPGPPRCKRSTCSRKSTNVLFVVRRRFGLDSRRSFVTETLVTVNACRSSSGMRSTVFNRCDTKAIKSNLELFSLFFCDQNQINCVTASAIHGDAMLHFLSRVSFKHEH